MTTANTTLETIATCTHEPITIGRPKIIGDFANVVTGERRVRSGAQITGCAKCGATLIGDEWVDAHLSWRVSVNGALYWHEHPMPHAAPADVAARKDFARVQVSRAEKSFAAEVARREAQREAGKERLAKETSEAVARANAMTAGMTRVPGR